MSTKSPGTAIPSAPLIRANNHIRTATTRRGSQYGRLANAAAEAPTAITTTTPGIPPRDATEIRRNPSAPSAGYTWHGLRGDRRRTSGPATGVRPSASGPRLLGSRDRPHARHVLPDVSPAPPHDLHQ